MTDGRVNGRIFPQGVHIIIIYYDEGHRLRNLRYESQPSLVLEGSHHDRLLWRGDGTDSSGYQLLAVK